jgi:hypothetical protein
VVGIGSGVAAGFPLSSWREAIMGKLVRVEIEVTPEAAAKLADPVELRRAGALVSRMIGARGTEDDPLVRLLRETQKAAEEAGLTEADVEAELAAYNAERRD